MIILPAIDILDAKAVRLYQGDYNTAHKVAADPLQTSIDFQSDGAEFIHLVDLSGAKAGKPVETQTILQIRKHTSLKIEVGGGIRDMSAVDYYISHGIDRVILGTSALQNRDFLIQAVKTYSDKIAVGIDARNSKVSVSGWLHTSDIDYIEFAKICEGIGVDNIIFTDISRDGSLKGPNLQMLSEISEAVSCKITASGGIKDIGDIKDLNDMKLYGAICGKSIYSGTLSLKEAIHLTKS